MQNAERITATKLSFIEQVYIPCSAVPPVFLALTYVAGSRAGAWQDGAAQAVVVSILLSIALGIPGIIFVIRRKLRNERVGLLVGTTLLAFSIAIVFIAAAIGPKW